MLLLDVRRDMRMLFWLFDMLFLREKSDVAMDLEDEGYDEWKKGLNFLEIWGWK